MCIAVRSHEERLQVRFWFNSRRIDGLLYSVVQLQALLLQATWPVSELIIFMILSTRGKVEGFFCTHYVTIILWSEFSY